MGVGRKESQVCHLCGGGGPEQMDLQCGLPLHPLVCRQMPQAGRGAHPFLGLLSPPPQSGG